MAELPPDKVIFFTNVVLHILILLIIISSFYFFYVSKLSSDKFKSELTDLINNNLEPALQKADNGTLKSILSQLDINNVKEYYKNKTDASAQAQNTWLKRCTALIIIVLLLTIILTYYILKQSCNQSTPMKKLLKENLILFFFVGLIEITFFMLIAKKFVPTKPSLMMETMISSLQAEGN